MSYWVLVLKRCESSVDTAASGIRPYNYKTISIGGLIKKLLFAIMAMSLVGCASVQSPVGGLLYLDAKGGVTTSGLPVGAVKGEACATSIMGLVGTGDASIKAAADSGGISRVAVVDHTSWSILGVYSKYCTVAYGVKTKAAAAKPGNSTEM